MSFRLRKIEGVHRVCCPHCQTQVYKLTANSEEQAVTDCAWVEEGVPLRDLYTKLRENKLATDFTFAAEVIYGVCPSCAKAFSVLELATVDGYVEQEFEDAYIYDFDGRGEPENALVFAEGQPSGWLVSRYDVDGKSIYQHTFGPFAEPEMAVEEGKMPPEIAKAFDVAISAWPVVQSVCRVG